MVAAIGHSIEDLLKQNFFFNRTLSTNRCAIRVISSRWPSLDTGPVSIAALIFDSPYRRRVQFEDPLETEYFPIKNRHTSLATRLRACAQLLILFIKKKQTTNSRLEFLEMVQGIRRFQFASDPPTSKSEDLLERFHLKTYRMRNSFLPVSNLKVAIFRPKRLQSPRLLPVAYLESLVWSRKKGDPNLKHTSYLPNTLYCRDSLYQKFSTRENP